MALKGVQFSVSHRLALSIARRKYTIGPERIAKWRSAAYTSEANIKRIQSCTGKKRSAEFCRQTSERQLGKSKPPRSAAVKAKISATMRIVAGKRIANAIGTPSQHSRYHSGFVSSAKATLNPVYYASGLESRIIAMLVSDSRVVSFGRCPFAIPYMGPDDKTHMYVPDFLVYWAEGNTMVLEGKPFSELRDPWVLAKAKAALQFCAIYGMQYVIWDDVQAEEERASTLVHY